MNKHYDAIIIGAGPAGLSAAIYLSRAQYSVLVVEKDREGGQVAITSEVVNYPGVLTASGEELTEIMYRQAKGFGAVFLSAEVTDLLLDQPVKQVKTSEGDFTALGVIAAMGANPRKVGFDGEEKFQGRGVGYCATCDGEFFTGKDVFVIGGGYAAAEEAVFLTRFAKKVHIVMRKGDFSCPEAVARPAKEHPKIQISYNTEIIKVEGDTALRKAVFQSNKTKEIWEYNAEAGDHFGVFVFAGYLPATSLLQGKVALTTDGYVVTDSNQKTDKDGVYAAGDLCVKPLRQVVTAVSDGAIAATSLEKHISYMHRNGYEKGAAISQPAEKVKALPEQVKPVVAEEKVDTPADAGSSKAAAQKTEGKATAPSMIPEAVLERMKQAFSTMRRSVILEGLLDDSALSRKVETFLNDISTVHENVIVKLIKEANYPQGQWYPAIRILDEEGRFLRAQFHGVPGGHELSSFLSTIQAAGGAGEDGGEALNHARKIDEKLNLKVLITLSCTMCPELVMAAQRIAMENPLVEAEIFDVTHYPTLREKYNIMSVPCLVVNDEKTYLGRKSLGQLVSLLQGEEVPA